jgi:cytochrome P450
VPTLSELPAVPAAPLVGNALQFRRDRLGFLAAAARTHGDAVRFRIGTVEAVLLSHPEAIRQVLVSRQKDFRKGPVLQRARAVLGDGLLTSEGSTHLHDRRLLQTAFHPARVERYAAQMVEVATRVVAAWVPGRPVDVHEETVRTTMAVAGRTLFGTDVEQDVRAVSRALRQILSAYGVLMLPLGPHLARLPPTRRRVRDGIGTLDGLTARLIHERRGDPTAAGDDLLSVLVSAGDEQWVRDQVVTMLLAGHETTANALAFACHLLAMHPDVQHEVAAEVIDVSGVDGVPAVGDLGRLPTVRAALAEAMRLFPPSWAMGRQAHRPSEVDGIRLPSGQVVIMSQWVVHRDRRSWPDPHRFDPWRFLVAAPARPRLGYFPFGAGTRQCIGEGFAWTEGVLTLATILARWRLVPVPGRRPTLDPLLTLRPRDGVWLVPEPRGRR